ncbi:MAG: hypothetical protein K0S65_1358 [Labilithrix sp.]|nr:hypothetical protein [Labilithrix sp.]
MSRKRTVLGAFLLAAVVACATSDDEPSLKGGGDRIPNPPVAASDDGGPIDGAPPSAPSCSAAGWCVTALPDRDLTLRDIWPFESSAFAIAESEALGVKILEWRKATNEWAYIDDNSQNAYGLGSYAGKIWAPNENEVYYTVAPSSIYHGTRASSSSLWWWERERLEDYSQNSDPLRDPGLAQYSRGDGMSEVSGAPVAYPALGVWGISADDVYAWYANAIFHRRSDDGGPPAWVTEHVVDDTENPDDSFFVFAAGGSSPDDVWFAGGRARYLDAATLGCPIVIHKAGDAYSRMVDTLMVDSWDHYTDICQPKVGGLSFTYSYVDPELGVLTRPYMNAGWLTNIMSVRPSLAVGVLGGTHFAYLASENGGSASANVFEGNVPRRNLPSVLNSVWVHGPDTWLSGWGLLLRTPNDPGAWSSGLGLRSEGTADVDAATYSISTTVLSGLPLDAPLYQVRGTSNTNIWAIGAHYALHKTTP